MKLFSRCTQVIAMSVLVLSTQQAAADTAPSPYQSDCALKSWAGFLQPYDQEIDLKEVLPHPNGQILAYELSPIIGRYAKAYVFLLADGTCFREVVSIGSYMMTAMMHDGPDQLFHGDHYEEDLHSTLKLFEGKPSYEAAKALALGVLN